MHSLPASEAGPHSSSRRHHRAAQDGAGVPAGGLSGGLEENEEVGERSKVETSGVTVSLPLHTH